MKKKEIQDLFDELGFIRTGGSKEELKAAKMIKKHIEDLGIKATLESFEVEADTCKAQLYIDGQKFACKGYRGCADGEIEAELFYLSNNDAYSLSACKDKIVLFTGGIGKFRLEDLNKSGALAFITTNGTLIDDTEDIDDKELRSYIREGNKNMPGVNINIKDAAKIIAKRPKNIKISTKNEAKTALSHNVVACIEGELEDEIVFTAHYDSVPLSCGIYDNLSGAIGILAILDHFKKHRPHYSLRFIFCGSEERGLLGSKAYVKAHEEELEKIKLCINLDMIGTTLGTPLAMCTSEMKLVDYLEYTALIEGYPLRVMQGVYSSDSTPFADKGIPAMTFARIAPNDMLIIHNHYDTMAHMDMGHMKDDIDFITSFATKMANAKVIPVGRTIPDKMKEKLDEYNCRKRPDQKVI